MVRLCWTPPLPRSDPRRHRGAGRAAFLDPAELARRYEISLAQGVEVDDALWRRIDAVAARVQVPASTNRASRGRAAATRTPELRGYSGRPRWRRAAVRVFCSRQAMVIGPTPPGTGVIAPATCGASA